jgi:uncharacterized protein (TIGR00369 family)
MTWITDEQLTVFVESRPFSPAAEELARKIIAIDPSGHRARLSFEPGKNHCNPMGSVQGGFLMAMLDEAMIEAVILATGADFYIPTLTIEARFLRPARLEKLFVEGRVMRLGRRSAFLEADLYGADGKKRLVTARSTVTMTSWAAIGQKSA